MEGSGEAGERVLAAGCDHRAIAGAIAHVGQLGVRERWGLTAAHAFGKSSDAVGVLPFDSQLLAGNEPVSSFAGAGGLDVGGLLAGLPSAGDDKGAVDGRALRSMDVLGVPEAQADEVVAVKGAPAAGDVELDEHLALGVMSRTCPRLPFSMRSRPGSWCLSMTATRSPARTP
jgi:hypothetical protein